VSPLVEVQLVTARELRKSFRSAKGVVLAGLSLAGGTGATILLSWAERLKRAELPPGTDLSSLQEQFFSRLYGPATGKALAGCPYSLWTMLVATLWLSPLLVALMGFDSVSAEMQSRTVRYWATRVRRGSYLVGKALGAWLAVLAVMFAMNVVVWAVSATALHLSAGYVIAWGLRLFVVAVPITAAWCAVATLVGAQFRRPALALLVTLAAFFGLWLVRVVAGFAGGIEWLTYLYPNIYDTLLLSPAPTELGKGVLGTGLIAVGAGERSRVS
jgi:ABC-type transport system involved in multi-copper enzyme maturation permease subunit